VVGTELGGVLNSEAAESLFCEKLVYKHKLDALLLEHRLHVNHRLQVKCKAIEGLLNVKGSRQLVTTGRVARQENATQ
jgi:hypothetical protein